MLSNAQYLLLKASNMPSIPLINTLIIASLSVSISRACMSAPSYVPPPPTPLQCIPCEHESEDWSWGLKTVWFLIRIITHLEYSCCKVETGATARHLTRLLLLKVIINSQFTLKRYFWSAPNCGRRGASLRRKLREELLLQDPETNTTSTEVEVRIVKNGKNPFRVVAGEATAASEIPWQVMYYFLLILFHKRKYIGQVGLLKSDLKWDGCGGLLLSCDPVVIVTAAHCVTRYMIQ